MKKLFAILTLCMALNGSLFSALPPLYQGLKELKAIIEDKKLDQVLNAGEMIMDIRKTQDGYMIVTNQHQLNVKVVYDPASHPGPTPFHIEFQEPTSLKD